MIFASLLCVLLTACRCCSLGAGAVCRAHWCVMCVWPIAFTCTGFLAPLQSTLSPAASPACPSMNPHACAVLCRCYCSCRSCSWCTAVACNFQEKTRPGSGVARLLQLPPELSSWSQKYTWSQTIASQICPISPRIFSLAAYASTIHTVIHAVCSADGCLGVGPRPTVSAQQQQ